MVGPQHHDPLLDGTPDGGVTAVHAPRGPIGNAARTLVLFGFLVVVGVAIWWLRRPDDLTGRLGGREWVIVEADDEPAVVPGGTASTFVLDGTGEARAVEGCNTAVGTWEYDTASGSLDLSLEVTDPIDCDDDVETFAPISGDVGLDGARLRLSGEMSVVEAVALADVPVAGADDVDGRWDGGDQVVEFGRRGLLRVGSCDGSWAASGAGIVVSFEGDVESCRLADLWTEGDVLVPVVVDDGLFLRRDRPAFPVDRGIHWFASLPDRDSPLLDEP